MLLIRVFVVIALFISVSAFHSRMGNVRNTNKNQILKMAGDADLLVRAFRGESTERTPVWLMRQAGRYMAAFRAYSEKYSSSISVIDRSDI